VAPGAPVAPGAADSPGARKRPRRGAPAAGLVVDGGPGGRARAPAPPSRPAPAAPFSRATLAGGSVLLESLNQNFLGVFLAANLFTGAANFSIYTLHAGDAAAVVCLALYLAAVCALAVGAKAEGVNIKVW